MTSENVPEAKVVAKIEAALPSLIPMATLLPEARDNRRDIHLCKDRALAIVTIDAKSAKECFYSLPRGGKKITGPSIGLAETLYSSWGNMAVSIKGLEIGQKYVTIRGWAMDMESGASHEDFIRRRICYSEEKGGGRYDDEMVNVTIAAARSILFRNLVLRLVPRPIVRHILDRAFEVAAGKGEDHGARQKKIVAYWEKTHGVKKEKLLSHIGKAVVSHIDAEDIGYLLGLDNAIKAGEVDVLDTFSPQEGPKGLDAITKASKKKREARQAKESKPEKPPAQEPTTQEPEPEPATEPEQETETETEKETEPLLADAGKEEAEYDVYSMGKKALVKLIDEEELNIPDARRLPLKKLRDAVWEALPDDEDEPSDESKKAKEKPEPEEDLFPPEPGDTPDLF